MKYSKIVENFSQTDINDSDCLYFDIQNSKTFLFFGREWMISFISSYLFIFVYSIHSSQSFSERCISVQNLSKLLIQEIVRRIEYSFWKHADSFFDIEFGYLKKLDVVLLFFKFSTVIILSIIKVNKHLMKSLKD